MDLTGFLSADKYPGYCTAVRQVLFRILHLWLQVSSAAVMLASSVGLQVRSFTGAGNDSLRATYCLVNTSIQNGSFEQSAASGSFNSRRVSISTHGWLLQQRLRSCKLVLKR